MSQDHCISKGALFQVMQREITNIGKALTCPICQSTYTHPVLLPCVHAFCHDCILSSFQHKHQCPCCKRPCQKRSLVTAEGLETISTSYKHVVRDAAFTSIEYDVSCQAMTQIAESSHEVLPEQEDVEMHIQVGQTWLEQLQKSGDNANEVLKRQQEAVVAVDQRVLRNLEEQKPAANHNNNTLEDSQGNAFLDAKETEETTIVQDITTILVNENLVKTPAAAATTTTTRDETCRRTNKTATTTTSTSSDCDTSEPPLQVMTSGGQETTSPTRNDESQQQYSESAAFFTADEDENNKDNTQDEASLTAATTTTRPLVHKKDNVVASHEELSVPKEVQVTFLSSIHEHMTEENGASVQQGDQVRISTLPTTTTEEAAGESVATTPVATASGVAPMDVDGSVAVPDATMADATQIEAKTTPVAVHQAESTTDMETSSESGAATMPTTDANQDDKVVPEAQARTEAGSVGEIESEAVARDELLPGSPKSGPQEESQSETVDESTTRSSDAREDQGVGMSDAKDSVQADVDEPMPDADEEEDNVTNPEPSLPMEEAADTETMPDAGAVPENPSTAEEEPMPEADGHDVDSGRSQQEEEEDPDAANEEVAAASLEGNDATPPPSVSTFAVGTIVQVEDRCWPGINKQGGVGRITKVHVDGGSILYDVAYVLGGREKKVEAVFVSEQDLEQKRIRSPKGAEKANLSPELLASLAADGFDTEGKVRLSDAKAGAKRKALDQNKSNEQATSDGKKKRQKKGKTAATTTKKKRTNHGSNQPPPALTDDEKRENANAHYDERFQMAEGQSIISIVASSLPEHEMATLQLLCKETKNQDVNVRMTETFNPSKTTLVVVAVDAKSSTDNLASRTRTLKVMRAILAGVPVVSPSWISSCLEAGKVVSPSPEQYIRTVPVKTTDPLVNANLGVSLLATRMHQENAQLLSNVRVLLCGQFVSSEGSPRKADIQALLRESGASVFTSEGGAMNKLKKVGDEDASKIVLLCDECPNNNRCGISTGLAKEVKAALERDGNGVLIVNSMWLFDSISCGQMAPPQPFKPRSARARDLWKLL